MPHSCADKRHCNSKVFHALLGDQRLEGNGFIVTEFLPTHRAVWAAVESISTLHCDLEKMTRKTHLANSYLFCPNATIIKNSAQTKPMWGEGMEENTKNKRSFSLVMCRLHVLRLILDAWKKEERWGSAARRKKLTYSEMIVEFRWRSESLNHLSAITKQQIFCLLCLSTYPKRLYFVSTVMKSGKKWWP